MDSQNPNQNLYNKPGSRFSHFRKRKQSETVKIVGNYRIGGKLGEGSNGFVYSAYRLDGEKRAAVKILPKTEQTYDKLKNEIDIISSISHTNVVQVYQIVEQQNKIFIFMEICSKGDLFYYIQKNKKLEEPQSAQIFIKIHQVLTYLHSQGITHRDIKAQNILLDQDLNPKLTDFGLARRYNHKENALLQTWCGSFNYAAPEIIKKRKYKPELVDLWSLTVLLYIMLIGKEPFNRFEDRSATKQAIVSYDWFKDPKLSKQANQFFQVVFVPPQHRISLVQVTSTSFYRKHNKNKTSNEKHTTFSKSSAQLPQPIPTLPNPTTFRKFRTNSNPHEQISNTLTQHLQKPLQLEYGNKSELLGQMIPRNRIELLHMLRDQRQMKNKSQNQTHMDRFRIRRSLPKKNQYLYDF